MQVKPIATDQPQSSTAAETETAVAEPTPEEVRDLIAAETGLDKQDVAAEIDAQQERISFLTDLSAAFLVAKQHDLTPAEVFGTADQDHDLEIANLVPDMNGLTLTVTAKFVGDINEFEKDDGTGQVRNVIIEGDNGGATQLTVWNDDVHALDDVSPGDTLKIEEGYTKQSDYCRDNFDCPCQIQVADRGQLIKKRENGEDTVLL